jgi:hypothetical protein
MKIFNSTTSDQQLQQAVQSAHQHNLIHRWPAVLLPTLALHPCPAQHDALVAFVDLLGWLRDQHAKHQPTEQPEQQQHQQRSLASLLGNTPSELLLLDQLRYLPYSGGGNHAAAHASAAAALAVPQGGALHHDEGDDAVASSLEQRIAQQGDLMYWLRWMLAQVRPVPVYSTHGKSCNSCFKLHTKFLCGAGLSKFPAFSSWGNAASSGQTATRFPMLSLGTAQFSHAVMGALG